MIITPYLFRLHLYKKVIFAFFRHVFILFRISGFWAGCGVDGEGISEVQKRGKIRGMREGVKIWILILD
jgi:hypothetical protein